MIVYFLLPQLQQIVLMVPVFFCYHYFFIIMRAEVTFLDVKFDFG